MMERISFGKNEVQKIEKIFLGKNEVQKMMENIFWEERRDRK